MLVMMVVMLFPLLGLALFAWLPLRVALPLYLAGLGASALLHGAMTRARRLPVRTGSEGLIGRTAWVEGWNGQAGWVRCGPERWRAVTSTPAKLLAGDDVRVVDVRHLTLVVERPLPPQGALDAPPFLEQPSTTN
ncbi:MAG: NfeD family protein [Acidobacteriota bacterium]|jgi:membrane-bound ClpP family serine protease